jgi:hypothetical protein
MAIRFAMSPAWRWAKNSIGSASTCHRKRLIIVTVSLVSRRSSNDCWQAVMSARAIAATAIPISNGTSQLLAFRIRMSSTKILEKAGITIPGTTSARLMATSRATACFEPLKSRPRMRNGFGLLPAFLKSAVGAIARTTPVKAASNAAMSISRRPTPGSLICARPR